MTAFKPRPIDSFSDAVTSIMGVLTPDGAGEVIGTKHGRVRAASDPDAVNYSPLNIEQCLALDLAFVAETGREGPIHRAYRVQYANAAGDACEDLPIVVRIGNLAKENGDALHALSTMKDPAGDGGKAVTPAEARAAVKELDELIKEAEQAKRDVMRWAGLS